MKWPLYLILLAFAVSPLTASIIKKPPSKVVDTPYKDLVCTDQDKAYIYEIISTMAENGWLKLGLKASHLNELGARIAHVHPLKFLSTIFSNPYLKSCAYSFWDDSLKRKNFLGGLVPRLNGESERAKLNQYIPDFGEEVNVSPESMRPYFEARDWENLVLHLINS